MATSKSETLTPTFNPVYIAKTAAWTGVSAGLVSYIATPLFPEQAFLKPALHTTVAAGIVFTVMPSGSAFVRSAAIGLCLAAQLLFLTKDCPPEAAGRFGVMSALAAYVGTEYVMPKLMAAEGEVANKYGKMI